MTTFGERIGVFLWIVGLATLTSLAAPAAAQTPATRDDVSLGYSFLRLNGLGGGGGPNMPLGWNASFAGGLSDRVAMVGDVSGNYLRESGESLRLHTFLAGARFGGSRAARVVPFGQVLAGLGHAAGGGDGAFFWGMQVGGGVDVSLGGGRAVRTQLDLPFYFDEGERLNALRVTVGVVLPLK